MNHYNSELSVQQSEVIAQDLSSCVSASIPSVQVQTDGDKKSHPGWCFKIYSGVLTLGVVFAQKVHEFSAGSDDSICTQVGIKFLSENPVTSLDFAVVCWF